MDESWVEELRAQFPVTQRMAFFDIAYENCGSSFAQESGRAYFVHKANVGPGLVKAGGAGKGETIGVISDTRRRLAHFLGAPGEKSLAFTPNTCQGINLVLQGFPWRAGDNVVVGDLEHPSVLMPCLQLKRRGVDCRIAYSADGMLLSAEELLARADEHTRIIVASAVQSCSGYRLDLPFLAAECHRREIFLVMDAIQLLGFQDVDVCALGVDALASSCYKGMLATEGVGFLYSADGLLERLEPVFAGDSPALTVDRNNWEILCPNPRDARKFETGTIPFQAIYALDAALKRIDDIGMERISAHVSDCFEEVYRGLEELDYQITTPFDPRFRCHSLAVREERGPEMVEFCLERGVFFSNGKHGHVRISVAPFTTPEDIHRLLDAAAAWRRGTA